MSIDLSSLLPVFYEEAAEHLETMEGGLLSLEARPDDPETLASVFRAAHSIKGAAGTFGLTEIARFTHVIEGVLDALRSGELRMEGGLARLLLRSCDALGGLVAAARDGAAAPTGTERLLDQLQAWRSRPLAAATAVVPAGERQAGERLLEVTFVPDADLLRMGVDPVLLVSGLASLGSIESAELDASALPSLSDMDPETSYLGWRLRLRTSAAIEDVEDALSLAGPSSQVAVEELGDAGEPGADAATECPTRDRRSDSIRVSTDRMDALVNVVGELVIAQAIASQLACQGAGAREMHEAMAVLGRNTREVQERIMAMRMVPISQVFGRFPRLARDLGASLGKSVRLTISGGDTEIDKAFIESLVDPLTHLVRNAADHGLESPEERRAAGKPETGSLGLAAWHESGHVVIEVSDDGRGLDTERIRRHAVEAGLLTEGAPVSEARIHETIFEPGFSTADQVSDVSGRGVGMDVVRRNVEKLQGVIEIQSQPGQGCRVRLRLPLTLAIFEGLSLEVGGETYVLPLACVVELLRPSRTQVNDIVGAGRTLTLRGRVLPLLRVHELLGLGAAAAPDPERGMAVIVEASGRRAALLVDTVLGQAQVVIKSLDNAFGRTKGVAGATILGDGRVALILDAAGLMAGRVARGSADAAVLGAAIGEPRTVAPQAWKQGE